MGFIDVIKEKAKQNVKTIVLPETEDKRTYEAAEAVLRDGTAKLILVGSKEEIEKNGAGFDISGATIVDPATYEKTEEYIAKLVELRSKKELIESFIATITVKTDVDKDWAEFVKEQQQADIETLITEEKLNAEELRKYLSNAFRDGQIKTSGTDIDKIMPPVSRFGGGARTEKKQVVIEKLQSFFEKYYGLI